MTVDDSTMTRPWLLYLHHYTNGADDAAAAADDYSVHIKTASAHDEDDDDVSPSAVQGNYMSLLSSLNLVNTKQALQLAAVAPCQITSLGVEQINQTQSEGNDTKKR